jgi:catechol 2,3-dioxygenase-like lactoylglutathione lyase family enzyme
MEPERSRGGKDAGVPSAVECTSALSLATHDMARAVRFYDALGFAVRSGGAGASFTSLHAGASYLNLIAQPAGRHWGWWGRVIFHVADVDAFYGRAAAAGLGPEAFLRFFRFFRFARRPGRSLSRPAEQVRLPGRRKAKEANKGAPIPSAGPGP